MKKTIITTISLLLVSVSPVWAKNEQVQNQTQTQNAGEESQLNVQVQEINVEQTGQASPQAQTGQQGKSLPVNAQQKMSVVSQKVKELLADEERVGGIGQEVREIAKMQNQAQQKIQSQVDKLASRSGLLKGLLGPDFKTIGNLRQELSQNQLRIKKLEELKNEVSNQAEETEIQEMIQALVEQNTALETQINQEEDSFSLFGWLVKLFNK